MKRLEEIKEQVKDLSEEELNELLEFIKKIKDEKAEKVILKLETDGWFDRRKHGSAYVAKLSLRDGKIEREFIPFTFREWDTKGKYYRAEWEIEVKDGEVYEARLTDGSWKNDYKEWFVIENGEKRDLESLKEARELLKR